MPLTNRKLTAPSDAQAGLNGTPATEANRGEITILLGRISAGDKAAETSLIDYVYPELHHIAMKRLRTERKGHTLQPTALVNEAYMKMCRTEGLTFNDRAHFFRIAVTIMRRVLVDYARKRGAKRRGDQCMVISIDDVAVGGPDWHIQAVEVNDLLDELAKCLPRPAQVAEMRYFAGLTNEDIAASLGCTTKTVSRDWRFARAWLRDHITSASSKAAETAGEKPIGGGNDGRSKMGTSCETLRTTDQQPESGTRPGRRG